MPTRPPAAIAEAARALAHKECGTIQQALDSQPQVHEAIHSARKSIRHLRALLQLVEGRMPEVQRADRILQRVGDSLSRLRDAHVAIATASRFITEDGPEHWLPVVQHLTRRRDALLEKTLARDPAFARRRTRIERVAQLLEQLDWTRIRGKDLRHGLEKGQRRVRKLRMQMEAVKRIAPDIAKTAAQSGTSKQLKALHTLSDQLGDCQDLDVLQTLLDRIPALPQRDHLRARIRASATLPPLPG